MQRRPRNGRASDRRTIFLFYGRQLMLGTEHTRTHARTDIRYDISRIIIIIIIIARPRVHVSVLGSLVLVRTGACVCV